MMGLTAGALRQQLQAALALDHPYAERPPCAEPGRDAAVLVAFAPGIQGWSLLFTRRTDTVETHKGQIAFPGGVVDPKDRLGNDQGRREPAREMNDPEDRLANGDFSAIAARAALREAHEEVGLAPAEATVLGTLPRLWTPTGFWVTPVVALLAAPLESIHLVANPAEVAEAFWVPLSELRVPDTYRREAHEFRGQSHAIHVYQVGTARIWGATGAMVKNLLDRMESLG